VILLSATFLHRLLGERGLMALERLMGMLLIMIAVQMFLDGLKLFLAR
jgi:multiple antibiotic resistance protein